MTVRLKSNEDESVNFVERTEDGGYFECRYVRRSPEYFIAYLSSHSGCNRGCRMCHLTATGQTMMQDATAYGFRLQARKVLWYAKDQPPAKFIHFNWMARGEPLANRAILNSWYDIAGALVHDSLGLLPKFNVSTIMPVTLNKPLEEIFRGIHPTIYYSLYSVNDDFRKKWLPAAMPPEQALRMLREYQKSTKKIVKLHWAFIKGENDRVREDLERLCTVISDSGLRCEINIVRYNPFSEEYGEETEDLELIKYYLEYNIPGVRPVKVIPRVGTDVKASCGMFVEKI